MFSYLDEQNVFERYTSAKKYTDTITQPFPEFSRILSNLPHEDIDPAYPKTVDGTSASIVRKTPRRVIQQLPTGVVKSDDQDDWLPIVADDIFRNKIIPHANEEYDLIEKCWIVCEKSLGFGACATYTPFLNHDNYLCPDMTPLYWGNVVIPKGKKSGYALPYMFMESWWQKEDIEALIASQKKLSKDVDKTWDTKALDEILNALTTKDDHQKTEDEKQRNVDSDGILLVTGFQKGVGAKFITFNPDKEKIVRSKTNKDPRGKMPIDWMYGDIDGTNPLGRSIIELIGPLQNLIDSDMQMYQYNRALMLSPPMLKKGTWNKNQARLEPNALFYLGNDPNADLIPLKIDTTAVANYPALYGLQKSQLLNLVSSPDTSISSDIGNPSFGKTPTAINEQKANISVDDNYIRKLFEAWFQHWAETAINLYFAERTGTEELELHADTVLKLEKLAEDGHFDKNNLQDNKIQINYDTATPALKFHVDASTSKKQDDAQQLQLIQEALQTVTPQVTYYMGQDGYKFNLGEAYRSLLNKLGIENIDKIVTKMNDQEAEEAKKAPFPIIDPPQIRLTGQIPPGAMAGALQNGGVAVQPDQTTNDQPIDMGDIYKDPLTSAAVKAQIQKMAGLTPDINETFNQMDSSGAQHAATQAQAIGTVAQSLQPPQPTNIADGGSKPPASDSPQQQQGPDSAGQQPQPVPQQQTNPLDDQIAAHLKDMGFGDAQIQQAIAMAEAGLNLEQILQRLGAPHG